MNQNTVLFVRGWLILTQQHQNFCFIILFQYVSMFALRCKNYQRRKNVLSKSIWTV